MCEMSKDIFYTSLQARTNIISIVCFIFITPYSWRNFDDVTHLPKYECWKILSYINLGVQLVVLNPFPNSNSEKDLFLKSNL